MILTEKEVSIGFDRILTLNFYYLAKYTNLLELYMPKYFRTFLTEFNRYYKKDHNKIKYCMDAYTKMMYNEYLSEELLIKNANILGTDCRSIMYSFIYFDLFTELNQRHNILKHPKNSKVNELELRTAKFWFNMAFYFRKIVVEHLEYRYRYVFPNLYENIFIILKNIPKFDYKKSNLYKFVQLYININEKNNYRKEEKAIKTVSLSEVITDDYGDNSDYNVYEEVLKDDRDDYNEIINRYNLNLIFNLINKTAKFLYDTPEKLRGANSIGCISNSEKKKMLKMIKD